MSTKETTVSIAGGRGRDAEWLSVHGVDEVFGIGRSLIYELIAARLIRSISLRRRGQVRGKRLVAVDSVRAYFASLETAQADEPLEEPVGPQLKRKGGKP